MSLRFFERRIDDWVASKPHWGASARGTNPPEDIRRVDVSDSGIAISERDPLYSLRRAPRRITSAAAGADSVFGKRWSSGGWDDEVERLLRGVVDRRPGVAHAAGDPPPVTLIAHLSRARGAGGRRHDDQQESRTSNLFADGHAGATGASYGVARDRTPNQQRSSGVRPLVLID
jgi:hypothetical protein